MLGEGYVKYGLNLNKTSSAGLVMGKQLGYGKIISSECSKLGDFVVSLNKNTTNLKIKEIVTKNRDWHWQKLGQVISQEWLDLFIPIKAPDPRGENDHLAWFPSVDGSFILRTTYKVWTDSDTMPRNWLYRIIWKVKTPHRD